ncbi:MAG: NfeD family protein [Saprospirales bacterium]|nr:NfeD family protein [Saprospirales bacterium]MBK8921663.1 NfeD family protein [Saprospirales bacterium]
MLLNLFAWWQDISGVERLFWSIGLFFNALFILYLIIQFTGGHDTDLDAHDIDTGFAMLSLRSLLAFGMFMGYTGVATLRLGFGWAIALLAGLAAGILAAWLAWRVLRVLLGLQSSGTLDLQNTIGQTGAVHLNIPAQMGGTGRVMVEAQGALREMEALSEEEAIPTGASILVVGITEDGLLIVQPFTPLSS